MTLTTEELREVLANATPWPWRIGSWQDNVFGTGPKDEWLPICRVKRDDAPIEESRDGFDACLIAAAPDLAAEVLALRAENERLRELAFQGYAEGYAEAADYPATGDAHMQKAWLTSHTFVSLSALNTSEGGE